MEAALSPQGTPEIPVVICYEDLFTRDHWDQLTDAPWWFFYESDLDRQMYWRKNAVEKIGLDWFELPRNDPCSEDNRKHFRIAKQGDAVFQIDTRTGEKEKLIKPHWSHLKRNLSSDIDRMPKNLSDIDTAVEAAMRTGIHRKDELPHRLAERLTDTYGLTHFPVTRLTPPLAGVFYLFGYEAAMMMIAAQPDLIDHACSLLYEGNRDDITKAARIGAAGIWIQDTFTDMIRPEDFERFNAKYLRRTAEAIRARNMKSIYYFCGNPEGKWTSMLSLGTDALAFEESKKGFTIDIESLAERVAGKYTLFGNLDALDVLPNASLDRLKSEIEKQIQAGRKNGNRFVMSIGSPVTPGTPACRVKQYVDLARLLGTGC